MTRAVAVLRPAPGGEATAALLRARGLAPFLLPLFETRPIAWTPPDRRAYDALLLTSAAAVRHAGPGLEALAGLPAVAVGAATARAARAAGLEVAAVGGADARAAVALARERGLPRLLHLAARERAGDLPDAEPLVVYGADPLPVPSGAAARLEGSVALLHSARAAARLNELADRDRLARGRIALAGLSAGVLAAAGPGWGRAAAAAEPTDEALADLARALAAGAD